MRKLLSSDAVFIWLSGGLAALCLIMVGGLMGFILINGLGIFWPREVVEISLRDQSKLLGEVWNREAIPTSEPEPERYRRQIKIGNRDLFGLDFRWVNEDDIQSSRLLDSAVVLERRAWGIFIGYPQELRSDHSSVAKGAWQTSGALFSRINESNKQSQKIAKVDGKPDILVMRAIDGATKEIPLSEIIRAYHPNTLSKMDKARLYGERLQAFLSNEPREANMEGGIFPAIFGTVLMVLIMSLAVVPLGVLAAVYMREYARQGPLLRAVRLAVNNLAGVPSIVVGVFGLVFFIYAVGGGIDKIFYPGALPAPTFGTGGILWAALTLALLTVPVVIVATEEGLAAVPVNIREGSVALGATQFETLTRLVLPAASPGILTGLILAMARAAGEVAPLMITGVVKLAPSLPVDSQFPYLHLERKFMHLGFHIYDVAFQSPNVEAAVPMVYATTLLLILVVVTLNLFAIVLRSRLRKRFSLKQL